METRAFVQSAFANGAGEYLDERRKWLLVRYVIEDALTLEEIKKFAGVTSRERARQLYRSALSILWERSPIEVQTQYPKDGLPGKNKNKHGPPQFTMTKEIREKISATKKGRRASHETKEKMSVAQREQWKRRREAKAQHQKAQTVFQPSDTKPENN
jgi:hypothetical protein